MQMLLTLVSFWKFIVFTVKNTKTISIVGLNRQAGYAADYNLKPGFLLVVVIENTSRWLM